MTDPKNIAILGATGSIGTSTLDVIRSVPGLRVYGISGHSRLNELAEQASEFLPDQVVLTDERRAREYSFPSLPGVSVRHGADALNDLVTNPQVNVVVAAIVGRAGLESTWEAAKAGKTIALANKEALVVAGQQITQAAKDSGAAILPVDSEHSAIFQAMRSGQKKEVERIVLTASGGPFRDFAADQLKFVTVEQALNHPTWDMGPKITVDSATMMNKALEIIEARWLFDLEPDQIHVTIHPQSIIHSMVEFVDGSVMAQMSPPDMKLPIQYALTFPDRVAGPSPRLDFEQTMTLDLYPPDLERFPALQLGYEVAKNGGTSGAVLNAANEAAVAAFLERKISFTDIVTSCREIINQHNYEPTPNLETLISNDLWAREEISKWIAC